MRDKMLAVINAKVSVPTWILALSSMGIAWAGLYLLTVGPGLGELSAGLPVAGWLWIPILIVGTTTTVLGLFPKSPIWLARYGSMLSFVMWIFGGIGFAMVHEAITVLFVVLPWIILYAYIYLASFFRDDDRI